MIYASQFGQDRFVDDRVSLGKRGGVFVDIGAYDGVTGSNSLFFERVRGWSGMLVEPVAHRAEAARRARIAPCFPYAVGSCSGSAPFLEIERGMTQMSGFLDGYPADLLAAARSQPHHRERIIEVPVRPLNAVLDESGLRRIDYLSLDVEGAELAILAAFDFGAFDVGCWSIENNHRRAEIPEIMEKAGYRLVVRLGVDEIYTRDAVSQASARPSGSSNDAQAPDEPGTGENGQEPENRAGTPGMAIGEIATAFGTLLYPAEETIIGQSLATCGTFSPSEMQLYDSIVGQGDFVVDAGAHIGWFTLQFARLAGPGGRVMAFEPQRPLFELLHANAERNDLAQIEVRNAALGERDDVLRTIDQRFDLPGNFGGASLMRSGSGISVPVMPLDDLQLSRCDLIKADVQGMEREVLVGAAATIERFRPLIYVENDLVGNSPALISTLFALGYRLFWHPSSVAGDSAPEMFAQSVNINMLCVPQESGDRIEGLRQVLDRNDWWREIQ